MNNIKNNLETLIANIAKLEQRYDRKPSSVKLLAVSKTRTVTEITEAIAAGQTCFGENYLQEAIPKITALADHNLEWHFIGPIQANKTRAIAANFSWVHSVSTLKIAQRLSAQRPENLAPLNICIQINISNEASKSGVTLTELSELATAIAELPNLNLRGLMAIPEPTSDLDKQRTNFHKLTLALQQLQQTGFKVDTLSMGMSNDYEAAIAEGATIIRIGTAIFGPRKM